MRLGSRGRLIAALGYWLWSALIAVGAGGVGAGLNCSASDPCRTGSPSWFQPWTWGEYDVVPDAAYVGLAGLAAATAFVALVLIRRRRPATVALVASVVLLSYPFFGGLTPSGRGMLVLGPLLAVAALVASGKPFDPSS